MSAPIPTSQRPLCFAVVPPGFEDVMMSELRAFGLSMFRARWAYPSEVTPSEPTGPELCDTNSLPSGPIPSAELSGF